jgi:hypothetical protein
VSSILKALKKVEKESPPQEVAQTLLEKIDTKKAVSKRVKGAWLLNRIASILLVIVILGMGTWFLWTYKGPLSEMISGKTPAQKPAEKTVVASAPAERRPPEQERSKETIAGETATLPSTPEQVIPKAHPTAPPTENDVVPTKAAKKPEMPPKEETPLPRSPQGSAKKPIDDATRYKLEAIVWSNNPESRFAVVNGQIVRAGSSLDKLSVTEIGRDHVAVRSGGREWKLKFTVE